MKYSPRFTYTFTPSSNTLNLSSNVGFSIAGLLAVIDVTNNVLIYATATAGLGYSAISNNTLTLQYNCSALSSTDVLNFVYDDGVTTAARPDQIMRVAVDPTSLLLDTFETLDTINTWTISGTVVPTQSAGTLTVSAGTAANASSIIRSQQAFTNTASSYSYYTSSWTLDAAAVTGNKRVFGLAVPNPSPTVTSPVLNGVVFEILDTDGSMVGAAYSNGTRTQTVVLSRPTDGAAHRYAIYFRTSRVYFELDSNPLTTVSIAYPNPQVGSLPLVALSVNGSTALSTAPTLNCSIMGLADTGRNNLQISDGTFPWRKATVKTASTSAVSSDTALVTTPHPTGVQYVQGVQSSPTNGTITSATSVVGPMNMNNLNVATVGIYGTYSGVSLVFEASIDNNTYFLVQGSRVDNGLVGTGLTLATNLINAWDIPVGAWSYLRVRATAWTSGTVNVFIGAQTLPYDPAPSAVTQGVIASGLAIPTAPSVSPVLIGGSDNGGLAQTATVLNTAQTGNEYSLATRSISPEIVFTGTITANDAALGAPPGAGVLVTGTPTTSSYIVTSQLPGGEVSGDVQVTGTFNSGTCYVEFSIDSTNGVNGNWLLLHLRPLGVLNVTTTFGITSATMMKFSAAGAKYIRARCANASSAPSLSVILRLSTASSSVFLGGSIPAGTNIIGTVNPIALTKGTQGTTGFTVQNLRDAGRNVTNYFATPAANTATDTLVSLTGYKGGAAIAATTTPAVVTTGKTFRLTSVTIVYVATNTAGLVRFTLRANTAGLVTISSSAVQQWVVGADAATAGIAQTVHIDIGDGMEFTAGTGIGVSQVGLSSTLGLLANGNGGISLHGFEY